MLPLIPCILLGLLLQPQLGIGQQQCPAKDFYEPVSANRILEFGQNTRHDSGSPPSFPCWFDLKLARIGQDFARKNFGHLLFAISLSLIPFGSDQQSRRIILTARRHSKSRDRLKSNLATSQQVLLWYNIDVLSPEWKRSIDHLRQIHHGVSAFVNSHEEFSLNQVQTSGEKTVYNDFKRDVEMWKAFKKDLSTVKRSYKRSHALPFNDPSKKFKLNQYTMAMALWAFTAVPILNSDNLGIRKRSEKDLQGFAHLWATIGYSLGMEEQFLFCKNPVNEWEDCKNSLKDTFNNHLLPQIFDLDAEGEIFIESNLKGTADLFPGIPPDVWLINFLEKQLGVKATNLRKQQNVASIVLGSTASWFVSDLASQAQSFQTFLNNLMISMLRLHSLKLFGDDGTNSTIVAASHFTWNIDH
ncbi:unnamed protein product [Allacma fusca]|uniref:ER-bound oxygenase mpaB/mpaB'/Rubber oxygenase catalytic domain-containing protein n=1 Tax=Allacma fusca TaxID=39272 RepID=A0A8J2JJH5_9HEXA|nr:unnamed protein product [Allacma fusca]